MIATHLWTGAQRLARGLWLRLPRSLRRWLVRRLEPGFLVSVVVIPVADDGRLLCVRHVFRPRAYPWGLPAGFLRRGEAPEAAALRELREETGFAGEIDALLAVRTILPDQVELLYRIRLLHGDATPASFEATATGLFPPHALPCGFLPSNLEALRQNGFPQASAAEH